jgi:hypothetical protein
LLARWNLDAGSQTLETWRMQSPWVLVSACAVSAVVGGLASGWLLADGKIDAEAEPRAKTKTKAEQRAEPRVDVDGLRARLDELEGRLSTLQRQQQARVKLQKYADSLAEGEEGETAVKPTPAGGVIDGEDPTFELAVRSVMDRAEWEKDEEQKVVRTQRRNERVTRQTELLRERLRLSDEQTQAVSAILVKQMESFRALRGGDDDSQGPRPATRSEWREKIGAIRQQSDDELAKHLSEGQMRDYRSFAEEEGIGTRGFGGRAAQRSGASGDRAPSAGDRAPAER